MQVNYGGVATHNSPHRVFVSEPANAAQVHIFGPGVEKGVKCNTDTHFNIDCRDAGQGILYYVCETSFYPPLSYTVYLITFLLQSLIPSSLATTNVLLYYTKHFYIFLNNFVNKVTSR